MARQRLGPFSRGDGHPIYTVSAVGGLGGLEAATAPWPGSLVGARCDLS